MKLTIEYNANSKHFDLKQDLQADIKEDAEALGYITDILFRDAQFLAELLKKSNPKYQERIARGIAYAEAEQQKENNPHYPFTTIVISDETK